MRQYLSDCYQVLAQKWEHLSACFKYLEPIRKIIYTTNAVEAIHRQFAGLQKPRGIPQRKQLVKITLRWHIKCNREMDHAHPELESVIVSV